MGLWLGREREQKQLYFSTSTTLHEAPEQVPASLRIKLPGKRSYRSLLCHSIRCVENSTLLMTAKDTCLTFNWTALSTTRHLRNKGEVAKKRKIKKRDTLCWLPHTHTVRALQEESGSRKAILA